MKMKKCLMALSLVGLSCSVSRAQLTGSSADFAVSTDPALGLHVMEGDSGAINFTIINNTPSQVYIALSDLGLWGPGVYNGNHTTEGFVLSCFGDNTDIISLGYPTTSTPPAFQNGNSPLYSTNIFLLGAAGSGQASITFKVPFTTDQEQDNGPTDDGRNYVNPQFRAGTGVVTDGNGTSILASTEYGYYDNNLTACTTSVYVSDVPEPGTVGLLAVGPLILWVFRRARPR